MPAEWILQQVFNQANKNPEAVARVLKGGLGLLLGKRTAIAITGMQGSGKTVLLHHLNGDAFKQGYQPPLQSQGLEKGKVQLRGNRGKQRLILSVIPGQAHSSPRSAALDDVFAKNRTDGVIHVVSNGYAVTRKPDAAQFLIRDKKIDTIEKYCEHQRQRELEDLKETCDRIVDSHHKRRGPRWFILVLGKVDLYGTDDLIAAAQEHYSMNGTSAFGKQLGELRDRVGTDFLSFDMAPVACLLQHFQWHQETRQSTLDEGSRDLLLKNLLAHIASYCT